MSKKNGGKKRKTAGTYKANREKMLERMAAHRVIHGAKVYKPKPLRGKK